MDNRYRDDSELHHAGPILAVIVAAMTLATAPLTQAGQSTAGATGADAARVFAGGPCSTEISEEICETRAFMDLAGNDAADDLASLPIEADIAVPMSDG